MIYEGKTNEEIAEYLRSGGDAGRFRITVRKDPRRFSKDIKPFLDLHREIQHALLSGLYEAWESNEDFEWEELLRFMVEIVADESFWKEEYTQINYRDWIVNKTASLIEIGMKDPTRSFEDQLLPVAEEILVTLAKRDISELSLGLDLVNQ